MIKKYKALISLFPTHSGGRKGNIYTEYNSNLVFGFLIRDLESLWKDNRYFYDAPDNSTIRNADAEINFTNEFLSPGEGGLVNLLFKGGREDYLGADLLKSGTQFLIREGGRVIGTGKLL